MTNLKKYFPLRSIAAVLATCALLVACGILPDEIDAADDESDGGAGDGDQAGDTGGDAGTGTGDGDGDGDADGGEGDGDGDAGDGDGDGDGPGDGDGDVCGDGLISGLELCDGDNLDEQTCSKLGFVSGELSCSPDCLSFDTSACSACGDGILDEGEACDGEAFGDQTCESLGFEGGGELGCSDSCEAILTEGCKG